MHRRPNRLTRAATQTGRHARRIGAAALAIGWPAAGVAALTAAAWTVNNTTGLIASGAACWVMEWLIRDHRATVR